MIWLRSVKLCKEKFPHEQVFPFYLDLIKKLDTLNFKSEVTVFVGENGSGKSTILESLAVAINLPTIGSNNVTNDQSLNKLKGFSESMKLIWNEKTHNGFFLRAEDFFGFVKSLSSLQSELNEQADLFKKNLHGYGQKLAVGSIRGQLNHLRLRYGEDLDANSHGESFLKLFRSRFTPRAIYLLDEPETPLSPIKQLSLISLIKEMTKQQCQFIIATHSPILMAIPNATILNFDQIPPKEVSYDNTSHVSLYRSFLKSPESFTRKL